MMPLRKNFSASDQITKYKLLSGNETVRFHLAQMEKIKVFFLPLSRADIERYFVVVV